jgi:hypothetical protein
MLNVLGLFHFYSQIKMLRPLVFLFLTLPGLGLAEEMPVFDAHSHYKTEDAAEFSPDDVIRIMDENNISFMVIVGEPPGRALELSQKSSGRIIPLLGLYQTHRDKANWMHDAELPGRLKSKLQQGNYQGIGEIHIFEPDKKNPNFKKILELAYENNLPVLLHGDRHVVQQAFEWFPELIVVWAHLGEDPDTDMLGEMLMSYPNLYVDTSVRDVLIIKDGMLLPGWKELFVRFSGRFMVAIDTYYTPRWGKIDEVTGFIRSLLSELPHEVARQLAYENAMHVYRE